MARRTIQYQPSGGDGITELAAVNAGILDGDPGEVNNDAVKPADTSGSSDLGEFDPASGATIAAEPVGLGGTGDSGSGGNGPGNGIDGTGDTPIRRRRGRQPGTVNKPKSDTTAKHYSQSLKGLESMLFGVHSMLAMITKTPELMLSEGESALLAKAAMDVAQHYPIGASEKTMAWANLAMVAGGLYGSRVVAVIQTRKTEAAKRPAPVKLVNIMDQPIAQRGPQQMPKPEAKKEQPMEQPTQHFHMAPQDSEAV